MLFIHSSGFSGANSDFITAILMCRLSLEE